MNNERIVIIIGNMNLLVNQLKIEFKSEKSELIFLLDSIENILKYISDCIEKYKNNV